MPKHSSHLSVPGGWDYRHVQPHQYTLCTFSSPATSHPSLPNSGRQAPLGPVTLSPNKVLAFGELPPGRCSRPAFQLETGEGRQKQLLWAGLSDLWASVPLQGCKPRGQKNTTSQFLGDALEKHQPFPFRSALIFSPWTHVCFERSKLGKRLRLPYVKLSHLDIVGPRWPGHRHGGRPARFSGRFWSGAKYKIGPQRHRGS